MVQLTTGVSPEIDSCAGLIKKRAAWSYRLLRSADKRWMDEDDVLQDNLVMAVEALGTHSKRKGQKYSTHLYNRINWGSGHMALSLGRKKRRANGLVELDAPIPGDSEHFFELPDHTARKTLDAGVDAADRVSAFRRLVVAVQSGVTPKPAQYEAVEHLVRVLLFGHRTRTPDPTISSLLAAAAQQAQIKFVDLKGLSEDGRSQKELLQWAAGCAIMGMGAENKLRCLECIRCRGKFTLTDVREGIYYLEPGVCRSCYKFMQADPGTCFGKVHSKAQEGFQATDTACRLHCPDREVCRTIAKRRKRVGEKAAVLDDKLAKGLDKLDAPAKATSEKSAKSGNKKVNEKKAEKPAAAKAKAEEADQYPPAPKSIGGVWPFRDGTAMRYCFYTLFTTEGGLTPKAFANLFRKADKAAGLKSGPLVGANHDFMLKVMKSGVNCSSWHGGSVLTHGWKFSEEGGRYRIYDVKFLGKAKEAKADAAPAKKTDAVKTAKRDKVKGAEKKATKTAKKKK